MTGMEEHGDWAGVAVALVAALVLIAGYFLIAWFNRAMTRRRVGFSEAPRNGHHLPDPLLEETFSDEHPAS